MMTKVSFHKSEMDGNKYTVEGITRLAFTIKASMKLRGWSERKLAVNAGVSHVTVNKYVRANIHEPQSDILKAIAPYIYKVSSIDQEKIEIYSDETYDQDWQSLEKLATAEFGASSVSSADSGLPVAAETPTRYKSKSNS
jgi:transcriptional regulator with XRE-family HTH domain